GVELRRGLGADHQSPDAAARQAASAVALRQRARQVSPRLQRSLPRDCPAALAGRIRTFISRPPGSSFRVRGTQRARNDEPEVGYFSNSLLEARWGDLL